MMDAEQTNRPFMEDSLPASSELSADLLGSETQGEADGVTVALQEDGSLLLTGRINVSVYEDGMQTQIQTDSLFFRNYTPGESWLKPGADRIDGNEKIYADSGILSRMENGSLLIEGDEENLLLLTLASQIRDEQIPGFVIEFRGKSLIGENIVSEVPAEQPSVTEAPAEQPSVTEAAQTLFVEWNDGTLTFSNPMIFHADEDGWHVEGHINSLEIRNYQDGKDWTARNGDTIGEDQCLSIQGGMCTVQDGGNALIIESGKEHPVTASVRPQDGEHVTHTGICVNYDGLLGPVVQAPQPGVPLWGLGGATILAALLGAAVTALIKRKGRDKKVTAALAPAASQMDPTHLAYGQLQQIGRRPTQQDCMGLYGVSGGLIAVVADGMGGLKNGDAVSRRIVQTVAADCRSLGAAQIRGNLMAMAAHANDEVNRMLGPGELYKSGSTLVMVLAEPQQFSWVSVGDSRIYLFRAGRLLQLNREHNFEAELLLRAVNHQLSFQEARNNPKRKSVSSFIGMGNLKYVDGVQRPIQTLKGDRILLCSDGIFNTLSEQRIEEILTQYPDAKLAAERLEAAVTEANNPHQDNFSAIILSYE